MRKSIFGMLILAICGLTGCLNADSSNIQTSDVMPAVVSVNMESGRSTLTTTWGNILISPSSAASSLHDGDCVLTQVEVDWDNQPNLEQGYITATKMNVSDKPIAKDAAEIANEEPAPVDYTLPILEVGMTNYTLKNMYFVVISHHTFQNQSVSYRMQLVKTNDYAYDAYLTAQSSDGTLTSTVDTNTHVFEFPSDIFPENPERLGENPSITLTLKYYAGDTNVWNTLSSLKIYQH
ncbi:hypothetical protein AGMMS49525_12090 [Bacteroidia bacterium]|nr:hypothetical protein AGMMS49525_12090 [Bacteroidia bacterium]